MYSNLWLDFILGSCIILLPLAVLILTIGFDLTRKEKQLMQRTSGSGEGRTEHHENYFLFHKKVENFKKYSIITYLLICVTLGILPLLNRLGFNWGWK
jgi:hypothetical protein